MFSYTMNTLYNCDECFKKNNNIICSVLRYIHNIYLQRTCYNRLLLCKLVLAVGGCSHLICTAKAVSHVNPIYLRTFTVEKIRYIHFKHKRYEYQHIILNRLNLNITMRQNDLIPKTKSTTKTAVILYPSTT